MHLTCKAPLTMNDLEISTVLFATDRKRDLQYLDLKRQDILLISIAGVCSSSLVLSGHIDIGEQTTHLDHPTMASISSSCLRLHRSTPFPRGPQRPYLLGKSEELTTAKKKKKNPPTNKTIGLIKAYGASSTARFLGLNTISACPGSTYRLIIGIISDLEVCGKTRTGKSAERI